MAVARGGWVIWLTFLLALLLTTLPMPETFEWGRPQWVAITLIYWVIALPHRVGVWSAWVLGLLMDILLGNLLGVNALSLALMAFLVQSNHQRIRMYPPWQQGLWVLVLVAMQQLLLQAAQWASGAATGSFLFMLPALISGFLWPWLFVILRGMRRALRVS